jgi:hypothetical protein
LFEDGADRSGLSFTDDEPWSMGTKTLAAKPRRRAASAFIIDRAALAEARHHHPQRRAPALRHGRPTSGT